MVCKWIETPNEGCKHIPLEKNLEYCNVRLLIHFCERVKHSSLVFTLQSAYLISYLDRVWFVFFMDCVVLQFVFFFLFSSPPSSGRFTFTQILPKSQLVHWHLSDGFTYDCLISSKQSQMSEHLHKAAFYHIRAPLCLK